MMKQDSADAIAEYESQITARFGSLAVEAAKRHAREAYPNESCGFITDKGYVACENIHETPQTYFRAGDTRYDEAVLAGQLEAIVHSHPGGPIFPSEADIAQQIATDVPWIILTLNEKAISRMIAWGDGLPIAPVIAREPRL